MATIDRSCIRCGTIVDSHVSRCPVCGANPDVGALVVRRSYAPAVSWRRVAAPVAAGAILVAVGTGIRLARQLLSGMRLRREKPQPPAVVEAPEQPAEGRIVAIRRRIWAVGDRDGARQWGAEETTWLEPEGGTED